METLDRRLVGSAREIDVWTLTSKLPHVSASHLSDFALLEYSFVSHSVSVRLLQKHNKSGHTHTHTHTHTHRPFHLLDLRPESFIIRRGSPGPLVRLPAGRGSCTDTTRVMRLK